jgi:hypothetical protein
MSETDIEQGDRWGSALAEQLDATDFGVVCLTPESLHADWLLFEAGSLSKRVGKARVVPYLYELAPTDVPWPLAQFQAAKANKEDTRKMIHVMN